MRAGQAGTALGLGRLGRSSNCSSFIYHQGQGADRTYRAVLIGNHDLPLYRISHPPRVVPTPDTIPRYKPLMMHAEMTAFFLRTLELIKTWISPKMMLALPWRRGSPATAG